MWYSPTHHSENINHTHSKKATGYVGFSNKLARVTPPYPQGLPSYQTIQIPAPQLVAISQSKSKWHWNHSSLLSSSNLDCSIQYMHPPGQRSHYHIWQSKYGVCENLCRWVQHWRRSRSSGSAIHQQHYLTITPTLPRLRKASHSLWSRISRFDTGSSPGPAAGILRRHINCHQQPSSDKGDNQSP